MEEAEIPKPGANDGSAPEAQGEKKRLFKDDNHVIVLPKIDFQEFKNEIHVSPKHEYKTIQSAIDAATPKTKVVIHPGIYREHLIISKKSDIELTSFDTDMPAIIIAVNSPCLIINQMEPGSTVKLAGLRFLHRGMKEDTNVNMNNTTNSEEEVNDTENADKSVFDTSFSKLKSGTLFYHNTYQIGQVETNYNIDANVYESIRVDNRGRVCALNISGATVMVINTQITLGFLAYETTKVVPGVYAEKSVLFFESVLIRGNFEYLTCGICCNDTSIKVTNSRIVKHLSGGILCSISGNNQVLIAKSQFLDNTGCGALIINKQNNRNANLSSMPTVTSGHTTKTGKTGSTYDQNFNDISLEQCLFDSNRGVGIKVENAKNLSLIRNKFFDNRFSGGEVIDCDGLCMLNEFVKNGENGIILEAKGRKPNLKFTKNVACENIANGILIKGKNNVVRIIKNDKITNNMKAGIMVIEHSHPEILNNSISTNFYQGVLVTSDACAHVEGNKIFGNLKANVAFGGPESKDTYVVNNELYRSRSEGVFIIEAEGGVVARNKIFENNDGVVMFKAKDVEVSENDIFKNIRAGVFIAAESTPKMYANQIINNLFVGVLFRDDSRGEYKKNIINSNPTQAYYDNSCKDLIDTLDENNYIEGRIDMETRCCIF